MTTVAPLHFHYLLHLQPPCFHSNMLKPLETNWPYTNDPPLKLPITSNDNPLLYNQWLTRHIAQGATFKFNTVSSPLDNESAFFQHNSTLTMGLYQKLWLRNSTSSWKFWQRKYDLRIKKLLYLVTRNQKDYPVLLNNISNTQSPTTQFNST